MSEAAESNVKDGYKALREWATVIGVALVIAFLVRGFMLQQTSVQHRAIVHARVLASPCLQVCASSSA